MSAIPNSTGPNTHHPLIRQVRAVAWRARSLLLLRWLFITIGGSILAILGLGIIDWTLRPSAEASRWIFSGLLLAGPLALAGIGLFPVLRLPMDPVAVAARIEAVFPALGDQLSSSIAFLMQDQQQPELANVTIHQTTTTCESIVLGRAINPWPTASALCFGAATVIAFSGLTYWFPSETSHAKARLTQPWKPLPWPREYHLALNTLPSTVAEGSDLNVIVSDPSNHLPSDVAILVRRDGTESELPLTQNENKAIGTLRGLRHSLEIRAVGGDDLTMQWHPITVVPPPSIAWHTWMLRYPEYTHKQDKQLESFQVEAVSGTTGTLTLNIESDVTGARLIVEESGESHDAVIEQEGNRSKLAFPPLSFDQSKTLHLELQTPRLESFSLASWRIKATPDLPPILSWIREPQSSGYLSEATLSVSWELEDDYGIQDLGLNIARDSETSDPIVLMRAAPEDLAKLRLQRDLTFNLSQHEFQIGESFQLAAWAVDTLGQRVELKSQVIRIESRQAIHDRITSAEQRIHDSLKSTIADQRESRDAALEASSALEQSEQSIATSLLSKSQTLQQRVSESIEGPESSQGDRPSGLVGEIADLLQVLSDNQLDDELSGRLKEIESRLRSINDQDASGLADQLESWTDQLHADNRPAVTEGLQEIGIRQSQVADQLESIAEMFSQRDLVRSIQNDLTAISDDQADIATDTRDQQASGPNPALGQRQDEIARRTRRLTNQIDRAVRDSQDAASYDHSKLKQILRQFDDQAIVNEMQRSAEELRQGKLGSASQRHKAIAEAIERASKTLDGSEESKWEFTDDQIDATESELEAIAQQQQQISEDLADPSPDTNEQTIQQWKELLDETSNIQERIQQLGAHQTAEELHTASQHQSDGIQHLEQRDAEQARSESQQARDNVDDAIAQLQSFKQKVAEQRERDQLWQMLERVELTLDTQRRLTEQIGNALEAGSAAQSNQIHQLQKENRETLVGVIPTAKDKVGFSLALDSAIRQMQIVEAIVARRQISIEAHEASETATQWLEHVVDALMQLARDQGQRSSDEEGDPDRSETGQDDNAISQATLQLLVSLQQWLNTRTEALHLKLKEEPQSDRFLRQSVDLAKQQQQLLSEFQKVRNHIMQQQGVPAP